MNFGITSLLSLLFTIVLLGSPVLSDKQPDAPSVSQAGNPRDTLDKLIDKKAYEAAYRSMKASGNKASDEEIVYFLLKSNGYPNWAGLTPIDRAWITAKVLDKPYEDLTAISAGPSSLSKNEKELIKRIMSFYRNTCQMDLGPSQSFWLQTFSDLKRPVHEVLFEGNEEKVTTLLNNPVRSELFYGFDDLCASIRPGEKPSVYMLESSTLSVFNLLRRLVAVVGAGRLMNPEAAPDHFVNFTPFTPATVENLLLALDKAFGFKVDFPNPYPGEVGLRTSRGVASYRAIQALYQAWKCAQLVDNPQTCKVLEIGGGLGRAAYYARKFGFTEYTIVDLPMTGAAQAHFLGSVLGLDAINLYGEADKKGVRIIPPQELFSKDVHYDLVVNFDGFTEMAQDTATKYWKYIERNASLFLSVNHDANFFTVRDLYTSSKYQDATRCPYWLRDGYIEEVVQLKP